MSFDVATQQAFPPDRMSALYPAFDAIKRPAIGHNGGPPIDAPAHVPEWGRGGVKRYFEWRTAWRDVWKSVPKEIALRRLRKAEAIGLTYEEYSLEIFERGRFLQPDDTARIAEIKAARKRRRRQARTA